MKNDLSHLSESELKELQEKYYGKGAVKDLVQEYDLNIRPGDLYKFFPLETTDIPCPYCDVRMQRKPVSKSEMNFQYRERRIQCPNCEHSNHHNCRCAGCVKVIQEAKERETQKKYDLLIKMIDKNTGSQIEIENATLLDRIYLGALLRSSLDENLETIHPISDLYTSYAPYFKFEQEILAYLQSKGYIKVNLRNCIDQYSVKFLNEDRAEVVTKFQNLEYKVNFYSKTSSQEEIIDKLINPDTEIPVGDLLEVWKLIALKECYEYMEYTVRTLFYIEYKFGQKAEIVFKDLLGKYSVGQIFNLIYSRGNYALRFKTEQRANSKHAANSILTMIANYAERVEIEKWELKNYNRPYEHPESMLSKFFFGRILKIGDKGFNLPPVLDSLKAD